MTLSVSCLDRSFNIFLSNNGSPAPSLYIIVQDQLGNKFENYKLRVVFLFILPHWGKLYLLGENKIQNLLQTWSWLGGNLEAWVYVSINITYIHPDVIHHPFNLSSFLCSWARIYPEKSGTPLKLIGPIFKN